MDSELGPSLSRSLPQSGSELVGPHRTYYQISSAMTCLQTAYLIVQLRVLILYSLSLPWLVQGFKSTLNGLGILYPLGCWNNHLNFLFWFILCHRTEESNSGRNKDSKRYALKRKGHDGQGTQLVSTSCSPSTVSQQTWWIWGPGLGEYGKRRREMPMTN